MAIKNVWLQNCLIELKIQVCNTKEDVVVNLSIDYYGISLGNDIECKKKKWSLNERISHLHTLGTFKMLSLLLYSSLSNPLQCSCLRIPGTAEPDGLPSLGSHRVGHDWRDFTFTFHSHALEKEMATHSSVLAWRIPGTAEPDGLPSLGLHRVGHDWSDSSSSSSLNIRNKNVYCFLI